MEEQTSNDQGIMPPSAPEQPTAAKGGIKAALGRAWRGQERLWFVFWIYAVVVGIVLQLLVVIAGTAGVVGGLGMVIGIPLIIAIAAYSVWISVSMWRCAWNAKAKFWGYIVRILTVLTLISYVLTIISMAGLFILGSATKSAVDFAKENNGKTLRFQMETVNPPETSAPDVAAPDAPASIPVAPLSPREQCEKTLRDHATVNGADANAYIAANQTYITQCIQQLTPNQ
jgi:hypothetical protein